MPGRLVLTDGGGDLDHLDECDSALLHPGAAAHGRGQQRESLGRRALAGQHEALGCVHADRAGKEAELRGQDGDPVPVDAALAGDDGLVVPGFCLSTSELGAVLLGQLCPDERTIPGEVRAVVQHEVEQGGGGEPGCFGGHQAPASSGAPAACVVSSSSSQAVTLALCSPSRGGARCCSRAPA